MNTTAAHYLYVDLPDNETDKPVVRTSILANAPRATSDLISPKAAYTIGAAHHAEPNTTTCNRCATQLGYTANSSDPETFTNTGFYVTPDGTTLCDECGDPDNPDNAPKHRHGYRYDLSVHWCYDCATATDYCTQAK